MDLSIGCLMKCGKAANHRGLCITHYNRACKRIKAKETTWLELEKLGEALPAKKQTCDTFKTTRNPLGNNPRFKGKLSEN